MDTYKFFFYANIMVIAILCVTIYLHNNSIGWLLIMLLSVACEITAVILGKKKKKKLDIGKGKD